MKVLITGGAGFIGSNLAKRLLKENCEVRILDNFSEQIHGTNKSLDESLEGVELIVGDIRDKETVSASLNGIDTVVHLAAETGTGQSMYEIEHYEKTNVLGTLNIIEHLLQKENSVKKIVVASSRAIYGEGAYFSKEHGEVFPTERLEKDLTKGAFDLRCPYTSEFLEPTATKENAAPNPLSFYALTKQIQEQMIIMYSKILGISGYALRYQNVYGPGQSLSNPYTGIMAIFSTLARKDQRIKVFEDGKQSRDFVYIDDTVNATWNCISPERQGVGIFNVGTGIPTSIVQVANLIVKHLESGSEIEVTGQYRIGDIRHNYADLSKAKEDLSFSPNVAIEDGLKKFLDWVTEQPIPQLGFKSSLDELSKIGLLKNSSR